MKTKKIKWICGLAVAAVVLSVGIFGIVDKMGFISDQASGITDDAAQRDYDTIDFDTVTIQEEEPPLGSSVNNTDAEEMAVLRGIAQAAFDQVNVKRAEAGLAALTWDLNLENAAAVRAMEISQLFSHTRPNGLQWYTVNEQIMHGENLAYGYKTATDAVNAWMNSPTHKENLLWPNFTKCAIAIYSNGSTYYFAQEFGY